MYSMFKSLEFSPLFEKIRNSEESWEFSPLFEKIRNLELM
jgi:hypothetical protein